MGRSADIPRTPGLTDGDDSACPILHVDMDAFFASVEIRRNPDLSGRPVVVGGGVRGVVAAASYEARRYGVRSAMSMGQALRLCPHAVVVTPDRQAYTEASSAVMAVLRDVTPLVEPLSLDEAFLDVSGSVRLLGRPAVIAATIRQRIERELGLTCSVGVAASKFVAKVASARCKPNGLLVVPADGTLAFLHPLPVTALWGVGARTGEALHRLGVRTIGDVAGIPPDTLRRAVGSAGAEHLAALAAGRDPRTVHDREPEKSISSDHTLDTDLTAEPDVARELLRLSDEVGRRVRDRRLVARTVGIKIRFADFRTVTRVRTLPEPTDDTTTIYRACRDLYRALGLDQPRVRLVGVKCENLLDAAERTEQLTLDALFATGHRPSDRPRGTGTARATDADPVRGTDTLRDRATDRARDADPAHGVDTLRDRGTDRPQPRPAQVARLGHDAAAGAPAAERAADRARERFGPAAVRSGSLVGARAAADDRARARARDTSERRRTDERHRSAPG